MNVLRGLKKKKKKPFLSDKKNASYPIFGFKSKRNYITIKKITRT